MYKWNYGKFFWSFFEIFIIEDMVSEGVMLVGINSIEISKWSLRSKYKLNFYNRISLKVVFFILGFY